VGGERGIRGEVGQLTDGLIQGVCSNVHGQPIWGINFACVRDKDAPNLGDPC
jgi:hypothetical protein